MTDRLTDEQRIRADYIKWELAARELGHAIHRRHALDDGPLIVRTPDDVTKNDRDRWATPEEVSEWKAAADAEVAKLTAKRDAIEKARLDEANSLERELARAMAVVEANILDCEDGAMCIFCGGAGEEDLRHDEDCPLVNGGFIDREGKRQ